MQSVDDAGGAWYKGELLTVEFNKDFTGFKGISKGKGGRWYGRVTGLKNHGHVSVPGTYPTAEEAAKERALFLAKLERKEVDLPVPSKDRVPRGTGAACPVAPVLLCE